MNWATSLFVNYLIYDNSRSEKGTFKATLQLGGDIKLPTGKNDIVQDFHTLPENLQPGSGTIDYLLNAIYTVRYQSVGINADVNYKIVQTNDKQYKRGDRLNTSFRFFMWNQLKNHNCFTPSWPGL